MLTITKLLCKKFKERSDEIIHIIKAYLYFTEHLAIYKYP